ncbi:MAG: MFS transporter, partial [Chloroflexota bacterium]
MTKSTDLPPLSSRFSTRSMIIIVLIMRMVMDTGTKLFFPYLSVIAIGLGTTPVELGKLLSWRNTTGLISPFLGATADRRGYRPIVSASLLLAGIGFLVIYFSRGQVGFLVGILMGALGGAGANPNMAAYLSHRLPWEKRARGLGVVEYAWGLASIIGVSVSGFLIAATNWRTPFLIIGLAVILFAFVFYQFPASGREKTLEKKTESLT